MPLEGFDGWKRGYVITWAMEKYHWNWQQEYLPLAEKAYISVRKQLEDL